MRLKKSMRRRLLLLLLYVAGATPAGAQSEAVVRGHVVAAADAAPLPGATIALQQAPGGEPVRVSADSSGLFVFRDVVPGDYVITGAFAGFAPRALHLTLAPREIRTVTLALDLARLDLSVDVAARPPVPSTHSPSSTTMTAAAIEALPPAQQAAVPDAVVTAAPGMVRGHDDFVHVRGEEVALNPLINGVAFWENPHALFSAGFSPEVIETARVMTGGFPAEYGNRFGGVVDIVTKSGLTMPGRGSVSANAGGAGRRGALADVGGRGGRTGYYLFGTVVESSRFLSPPAPQALHDRAQAGHAFLQVDHTLARAGAIRAIGMGDGMNLELPRSPDDVRLRPIETSTQRNRQQSGILGWTRAWSGGSIAASMYQRWSKVRLLPSPGERSARAEVTRALDTLGGKVDATWLAGRHAFRAGADIVQLRPSETLAYDYGGYRTFAHLFGLPHVHVTGNAVRFAGRSSGGEEGVYAQDQMRLGRRVTADVGLRVDRYHLVIAAAHASPRLNLAVEAGRGTLLHASYNEFFVPPPIEGALSSGAGLTVRIGEIGIGLPPVQATTERQVEVGASAPAGPVRLAVTAYRRASDNPVHTTVWPDARLYSYASFRHASARGLEGRADVQGLAKYGVTGYLNYALGRVYFVNPVTGGFITEPEHLRATNRFLAPMDQTHTLTGGLSWLQARTGLRLGTTVEYGSGTPRGHGAADEEPAQEEAGHAHTHAEGPGGRIPGHTTVGLSLGIDGRRGGGRAKVSLQVDVENLANHVYLVAQEGEFSPGQFSVPRLVSASVKIRF